MRHTYILGISAHCHDIMACLLGDGDIVAVAQEERFTRKKGDADFPNAVVYCLRSQGISTSRSCLCRFYNKPLLKFERILETYLGQCAPAGFRSSMLAGPLWIKEKLFIDRLLRDALQYDGELLYARTS